MNIQNTLNTFRNYQYFENWNLKDFIVEYKDVPDQKNGFDCGLFVIYFIECILNHQEPENIVKKLKNKMEIQNFYNFFCFWNLNLFFLNQDMIQYRQKVTKYLKSKHNI